MTPQQASEITTLEGKINKSVTNIERYKEVLQGIAANKKADPMGRAIAAGIMILVNHTEKDSLEKELDHLKRESRFVPLAPPPQPRKKGRKRGR